MFVLQYRLDTVSVEEMHYLVQKISKLLEDKEQVCALPDMVSLTRMSIEELEQVRDLISWMIIEAKKRINEESANN